MNAEIATTVEIPLGQIATGAKPATGGTSHAYVGFRGERAKSKLAELDAAGVKSNQFYLGDVAGVLNVQPFDAHLLSWAWFFTQLDKNGQTNDILIDSNDDKYKQKFRKHLLGLLAVKVGDDFVLATFGQRNAMVQGFERGIALLKKGGPATDDAAWARRSSAHKATVDLQTPFRFRLRLWGETKEAGDGDCNVSHAEIIVTPSADIPAIKQLLADRAERIDPILRHYVTRVAAWMAYAKLSDEAKRTANLPF